MPVSLSAALALSPSPAHAPRRPKRPPRPLGTLLAPCLALSAALAVPSGALAQATLLTPFGPELSISNSDDAALERSLSGAFPSGLRIGSEVYTSVYVGTNGYVTFGQPFSGYVPTGVAGYSNSPLIAAQMDDIHPGRGNGSLHYNIIGNQAVITWNNVEPYSNPIHGSGANRFQIVLRRDGDASSQDFTVELRYAALNWMTSGNLGPHARPTAGFTAGDGAIYVEPPESGTLDFLSLAEGSGTLSWEIVDGAPLGPPTVNATTAPSQITDVSALTGGTVSARNGYDITARGVVYATTSSPTIDDSVLEDDYDYDSGDGLGDFSSSLEGLTPNTLYYVRAFATNQHGTGYGQERSFRTKRLQTLTFVDPGPRTYGDAPFALDVSLDNANVPTVTSSDPSVAQISGHTVTLVGAGTTTLRAAHSGGSVFMPVSEEHVLTVSPRALTGSFTVPATRVADGGVEVEVLSRALEGVLPQDDGAVELLGVAVLADPLAGPDKVVTLEGASLGGARAAHYSLGAVPPTTLTVLPGPTTSLQIESAAGGPLAAVAPELPFAIRVTAFDAFGNVATHEDRPVTVSSSGTLSLGEGESPPLQAGTLAVDVALSSWGTHTLTAALEPGALEVTSAPFLVAPPYGHLRVSLEVDEPRIVYGERITLVVRVTNDGQHAASDPLILNPLHDEPRLVVEELVPSAGHVDAETGGWSPGPIAPGATVTLTLHARGVHP